MTAQLYRPVWMEITLPGCTPRTPDLAELQSMEPLKPANFRDDFDEIALYTALRSRNVEVESLIPCIEVAAKSTGGELIVTSIAPRWTMAGLHTQLIFGYDSAIGYYGSSTFYLAVFPEEDVREEGSNGFFLGGILAELDTIWMED